LKEDVLDDLPPKIIQDYACDLSPLQKQLYEDFSRSRMKQEVEGEIRSGGDENEEKGKKKESSHIFQAIQYLKKLVNHPALVFNPEDQNQMKILAKCGKVPAQLHEISNAPKLLALK
jgi:TATA-binding protein-associated factor